MGANVLIVDDSTIMRRMIRRTLDMAGLDIDAVYEAANGFEALVRMSEHPIGVVMLDVNMPEMDGATLLRRMRADVRLRDIPVVIASSEGSATRMEELRSQGACGYIRKPFHPEQVRDVLLPIVGAVALTRAPDPAAGETGA